MPEHGPFNSGREALATRAAAFIAAAFDANPGVGASEPACLKVMTDACETAGVVLGDYDLRLLRWLAKWETAQAVSLAGMITRAFEAGKAAPPEGTVTRWGIRLPEAYGSEVHDFGSDGGELNARRYLAGHKSTYGEESALVCQETGPWKEIPGARQAAGAGNASQEEGAGDA